MSDAAARALRERAERVLPGGVSSPVRAFRAVPGVPPAIVRGEGAHVSDADGRDFVDFILAYGPHILGHNPPQVVDAVREQLTRGVAYGMTVEVEVELAERIVDAVPSLEMVRFVNSGTEAAMSAVRLARAATGRDIVVTFVGGYHGHSDALLASAGSGMATLGIPASPGVPAGAVANTVVVPYNDVDGVRDVFARDADRIACVLVEPVAGNMGCVLPLPGFLEGLRDVTREHGALLVFDEVMTGFRLAYGGAQERFGVMPDITCLGKVIGGGFPVGAYGASAELMRHVAPAGSMYQAGTLSGNPVAMAAGVAVLDVLREGSAYTVLEERGAQLEDGLRRAARDAAAPVCVQRCGSMLTPFVGVDRVIDFASAKRAAVGEFATLHQRWLEDGVLWPPSQFEAAFLSTAHTIADVDHAVESFAAALRAAAAKHAGAEKHAGAAKHAAAPRRAVEPPAGAPTFREGDAPTPVLH